MATPTEAEDTPMADADAPVDATEAGDQDEEQEKLSPETYDAMATMLEALYDHRDEEGHDPSKLFHKRPNRRNVPGYYDVIKEPMAMSNLKSKINGQQYTKFAEFVRDCALIWHNAFEFNRPDSIAYQDANVIKGLMESELQKIVAQDLVESSDAAWPDLGEIPPADEDAAGEAGEDEEEAESGEDDEDDEEGGDNSEAEANKPRRRGRRPSAPKRSDSQAESSNKRRGRPPKVDTPLEARIKNVLKAIRKPKHDNGTPMIVDFEKLPDKAQFPEYYHIISQPMSLEQIKRAMKRKRFKSVDDCVAELDVMFKNAIHFNEEDSPIYNAAVRLISVAHQTAIEEKQKPDESFSHEEGRKPKPAGIQHNGQLWKVGDWVHIQNPNDATKPIVAQIYRTWEDDVGRDWVNACWYYRPEQTVHHFEKHFWPNEVLKTSQYRDHPIEEVIDKCFVMFFTRFTRGRPRNLPENTEVYVCEARYNEEKHKINKIKTWSSCLPDEVRDHDYEMDLFDTQKRIKKLPTPLQHMIPNAKDPATAPLPQPKMGAEDAPPTEGGVYKGARDENQSPPPSATPSPPPPTPAQPARPASSSLPRESPSKSHQGDVDTAMANAHQAFGVVGSNRPQNFVQQRQQGGAGTPHTSQHSYGNQYGSGQASQQQPPRSGYESFGASPSANRYPTPQQPGRPMPAPQSSSTNHGPVRLSESVNSAIPADVRARFHTDDEGHVLFFSDPPLQYADVCDENGKVPVHMRTSIRYRAQKLREKLLKRKEAKENGEAADRASSEAAMDTNHEEGSGMDIDAPGKAAVENSNEAAVEKDDEVVKPSDEDINSSKETTKSSDKATKAAPTDDLESEELPLWKTNPISAEELMLVEPEEILKLDPRRVHPYDNAIGESAGKPFLQWAYEMNVGSMKIVQDSCSPDADYKKAYFASIRESFEKRAEAARENEEHAQYKAEQERKAYEEKRDVFKPPKFYIEDIDPLYCGTSWTGPNPGGFKY